MKADLKTKITRIVDFTIADARLHNNLEDLSNESVNAILALIEKELSGEGREWLKSSDIDRLQSAEGKLMVIKLWAQRWLPKDAYETIVRLSSD